MKRYALQKDLKALEEYVLKLAEQVNLLAQFQAFNAIKDYVSEITPEQREKILELSKGHVSNILFKHIFKVAEREQKKNAKD